MPSMQQLTIIGYLGKDPEMRYVRDGSAVANFSVAVTENWKDRSTGEPREHTEWFDCSAFGRTGEVVGEFLHKGSLVHLVGKLKTRSYEKDGVKRYATDVRVDNILFLDKKGDSSAPYKKPDAQEPAKTPATAGTVDDDDLDDDIPF